MSLKKASEIFGGVLTRLFPGRKRLVGVDRTGNKYFERTEENMHRQGAGCKRFVEYTGDFPDARSVPIIWYQWLHFSRTEAPTPEEYQQWESENDAKMTKFRKFDEEQERTRLQDRIATDLHEGEEFQYEKKSAVEKMIPLDDFVRRMKREHGEDV